MRPSAFALGSPAWTVLVAGALGLTSTATLLLAPGDDPIVGWWPAAGLAVTLTALTPYRWWWFLVPFVGAANIVANLFYGSSMQVTAIFATLTMTETVVGGWVLRGRRSPAQVALHNHRDGLRLLAAAFATAAVIALGASGAALISSAPEISAVAAALTLFPAHLAAVLVVVPAMLSARTPQRRFSRRELIAQLALLGFTTAVVFAPGQHLDFSALLLPLLSWAAFRFGLRVASWQVLAVAVAVSVLTTLGYGPFATAPEGALSEATAATLIQAYIIAMALLSFPVAIGVNTSDRLHRKLKASRDLSAMTLATTDCIILVSDRRGTVLSANEALTTVLGHSAESVIGRPIWHTIIAPEHRDLASGMFSDPDAPGVPGAIEARLWDLEGTEHRIQWTTGIVRDEDGKATHVVMTGLDVTAERSAAGLMEHLQGAAIDTAIIGVDTRGRITLFNTGAQKILELSAHEGVGADFTSLLDQRSFDAWAARCHSTTTFDDLVTHSVGAPPQDWEWRTALDPEAQLRRVSMSLSEVRDHSDALIGYLCVASDVTEAHATAELLVNALEKERQVVGHLKALDTAKDQFVSTVSHELRTPVSTIIGYVEMLADGDLGQMSAKQVKALKSINRSGERLVDMVDNLLALSGMSARGPTWDRESVDVGTVFRDVEAASAKLLAERTLFVTFDVPDQQVRVLGDRAALQLALSNLVNNAVKFTPDGGQVRCCLDVIDDHARVIVHDTGLGIPKDEVHRVFDRFWRSTTSQTYEIQGTGMGMATVLGVVSAHGGNVVVDSDHLSGTTVTMLLPLTTSSGAVDRADDRLE